MAWGWGGWDQSKKWQVADAQVSDEGVCSGCASQLATIDLDSRETEEFGRCVEKMAGKRAEEFQHFKVRAVPVLCSPCTIYSSCIIYMECEEKWKEQAQGLLADEQNLHDLQSPQCLTSPLPPVSGVCRNSWRDTARSRLWWMRQTWDSSSRTSPRGFNFWQVRKYPCTSRYPLRGTRGTQVPLRGTSGRTSPEGFGCWQVRGEGPGCAVQAVQSLLFTAYPHTQGGAKGPVQNMSSPWDSCIFCFFASWLHSSGGTPLPAFLSAAGGLSGAEGGVPPFVRRQAAPHHRSQQEGTGPRCGGPLCAAVPAQVPRGQLLLHHAHRGQRRLVCPQNSTACVTVGVSL